MNEYRQTQTSDVVLPSNNVGEINAEMSEDVKATTNINHHSLVKSLYRRRCVECYKISEL